MAETSSITEGLTAKAGPLPVWGWAIAVSAPIIAYRVYTTRKAAAAAAAAATATTAQPSADSYPLTGVPGTTDSSAGALGAYSLYNPGGIYTGDGSTTSTTSTAPTSNNQWRQLAADKLTAAGYDPSQVNTALTAILSGIAVTPQQEALFNEAVRAVGSNPPDGTPTITLVSTGATGDSPSAPTGPAAGDTQQQQGAQDLFSNSQLGKGYRDALAAGDVATARLYYDQAASSGSVVMDAARP